MAIALTGGGRRRAIGPAAGNGRGGAGTGGAEGRGRRVTVLLLGIVVLSVADLVITLAHLRSIGMIEANPIAAWLIRSTQSSWVLAAYKALTVGVCVTLLFRLRRHLAGEIAAWCGVAILAGMAFLWFGYSSALESPAEVQLVQGQHADQWLVLD